MKYISTNLICLILIGISSVQGQSLSLNKGEKGFLIGGSANIVNQYNNSGGIGSIGYGGSITSGTVDLGIAHSFLFSDDLANGYLISPFLFFAGNSQDSFFNLHFGVAYGYSKVRYHRNSSRYKPQIIHTLVALGGVHKTHSSDDYRMTPYLNVSRGLSDGGQGHRMDTLFSIGLDVYQHKPNKASGLVYGPQIGYSIKGVFTAAFSLGYLIGG